MTRFKRWVKFVLLEKLRDQFNFLKRIKGVICKNWKEKIVLELI